jgi:hypothetical protein
MNARAGDLSRSSGARLATDVADCAAVRPRLDRFVDDLLEGRGSAADHPTGRHLARCWSCGEAYVDFLPAHLADDLAGLRETLPTSAAAPRERPDTEPERLAGLQELFRLWGRVCQDRGEPAQAAYALSVLGMIERARSDHPEARRLQELAVAVATAADGHPWAELTSHLELAWLALDADVLVGPWEARRHLEEASRCDALGSDRPAAERIATLRARTIDAMRRAAVAGRQAADQERRARPPRDRAAASTHQPAAPRREGRSIRLTNTDEPIGAEVTDPPTFWFEDGQLRLTLSVSVDVRDLPADRRLFLSVLPAGDDAAPARLGTSPPIACLELPLTGADRARLLSLQGLDVTGDVLEDRVVVDKLTAPEQARGDEYRPPAAWFRYELHLAPSRPLR